MRAVLFSILLLLPAAVAGQIDTSALQRCVWACLAGPGKGDAASAAYNACVAERCSEQPAAPQGDAGQGWVAGRTGAGVGVAGVTGAHEGTGLYYFCGQGQSYLRVIGVDGGERGMIVVVDGTQFPLNFQPNDRNQPESALAYSDPVIGALQRGSQVRVMTYDGIAVVEATLTGAGRALAQVISSC